MAASKILKPAAGVVILLGLYAAAGYLGVPAGVRWAVSNMLSDALGVRQASVGEVSFNPWTWKLTVHDLSIKSARAPQNNLLALRLLELDVSGRTLAEMAPVLEAVTVEGLNVTLTANAANNKEARSAVNADAAFESSSGGLPAFSLSNVRVTDSSVRLTNPQYGANVNITDIDFALPLLSTLSGTGPGALPSAAPKLSLKIDGKPIKAQGTLKGRTASLNLKVDDLNVASLLKAAPLTLPVSVEKATASCDLALAFDLPESGSPSVRLSGSARADGVDVRNDKKQPFVSVKSAAVSVKNLDVAARHADIASVRVVNPDIRLCVASQAKASAGKAATSGRTSSAGASEAWSWSLTKAELINGAVRVTDTSLKPAATLAATNVNLTASHLTSAKGKAGSYQAAATLAQGKLSSKGTLSVTPLAINADTRVQGLAFTSFNPWIKALAGAKLTKGTADVTGRLAMSSGRKLELSWKGDLAVSNLQARNAAGKTLISWTQAKATGVDVKSITPVHIALTNLTVKEPAKNVTQTVTKAAGLVGLVAALTGHENTARHAEQAAKVVSSDISISNVVYKDGQFGVTGQTRDKAKEALSSLVIESLNGVFGTAAGK